MVLSGNLNEIKKSYGRVNLIVKAEEDISSYINELGLKIKEETPDAIMVKLDREEQANELLHKLVDAGVNIIRFELAEPSLHEIFVEKVGDVNEEK